MEGRLFDAIVDAQKENDRQLQVNLAKPTDAENINRKQGNDIPFKHRGDTHFILDSQRDWTQRTNNE